MPNYSYLNIAYYLVADERQMTKPLLYKRLEKCGCDKRDLIVARAIGIGLLKLNTAGDSHYLTPGDKSKLQIHSPELR